MGAALLMAPLLLFLVLAYAWPFLGVVKWSFTLPSPGLGQYEALLTDDLVQSVFIRTLRIAAIVTVVSVAAAYAITVVWVRGTPAQRLIAE
jgi:putative spermidine/putrescine transport system permease protein